MILYNITTKVDHSIADEWVKWMLHEHAPEMIATLCFKDFTLVKLIDADDEEGITYAVQYQADSMSHYTEFTTTFAPQFQKKALDKWGHKFIAFRTVMEVIQ